MDPSTNALIQEVSSRLESLCLLLVETHKPIKLLDDLELQFITAKRFTQSVSSSLRTIEEALLTANSIQFILRSFLDREVRRNGDNP